MLLEDFVFRFALNFLSVSAHYCLHSVDIELPVMECLRCFNSVLRGEVRVELLANLHHLLAGEAVAPGEF